MVFVGIYKSTHVINFGFFLAKQVLAPSTPEIPESYNSARLAAIPAYPKTPWLLPEEAVLPAQRGTKQTETDRKKKGSKTPRLKNWFRSTSIGARILSPMPLRRQGQKCGPVCKEFCKCSNASTSKNGDSPLNLFTETEPVFVKAEATFDQLGGLIGWQTDHSRTQDVISLLRPLKFFIISALKDDFKANKKFLSDEFIAEKVELLPTIKQLWEAFTANDAEILRVKERVLNRIGEEGIVALEMAISTDPEGYHELLKPFPLLSNLVNFYSKLGLEDLWNVEKFSPTKVHWGLSEDKHVRSLYDSYSRVLELIRLTSAPKVSEDQVKLFNIQLTMILKELVEADCEFCAPEVSENFLRELTALSDEFPVLSKVMEDFKLGFHCRFELPMGPEKYKPKQLCKTLSKPEETMKLVDVRIRNLGYEMVGLLKDMNYEEALGALSLVNVASAGQIETSPSRGTSQGRETCALGRKDEKTKRLEAESQKIVDARKMFGKTLTRSVAKLGKSITDRQSIEIQEDALKNLHSLLDKCPRLLAKYKNKFSLTELASPPDQSKNWFRRSSVDGLLQSFQRQAEAIIRSISLSRAQELEAEVRAQLQACNASVEKTLMNSHLALDTFRQRLELHDIHLYPKGTVESKLEALIEGPAPQERYLRIASQTWDKMETTQRNELDHLVKETIVQLRKYLSKKAAAAWGVKVISMLLMRNWPHQVTEAYIEAFRDPANLKSLMKRPEDI